MDSGDYGVRESALSLGRRFLFFYSAMGTNTMKTTELVKVLARYCRCVPDWLENEYRVPTRVPYGILTVSFVPPPPERDYVPERAFRWVEEDERRRTIEWRVMRDDARQRYLVLEIGVDDDEMLYHRYYGVPQHVIIASALQLLERNDSDGDGQLL